MADDVSIKIITKADTKGSESAQKSLDAIGKAAQNAAEKSQQATAKASGGFAKLGQSVERISSVVGKFGAVFNAFGVVGIITGLIGTFKSLYEWLNRNKTKAEEMARAIQDAKNEAAIAAATERYKALNAEIAKAVRQQQLNLQLAAQDKAEKEGTEDAKLNLAEQQELAAIAADDPDAAQKATLISNKYAKQRAEIAAKRAVNERITAQQNLENSASQKEEQAAKIMKDLEADDTVIDLKRQMRLEKDPERKRNLSAQVDKLIEENQRKEADAASLRESAAEDRAKAQALFGAETAAVTQSKADIVRIDKSTADAKAQMEANQKRRAEEAAKKKAEETARADALARQNAADKETIETGSLSITHLQDQIRANELAQQEAQGAYENERMDVFRAQNNLSLFNTQNAGRRGGSINRQRTALQEELHKETEEMHAAETELNKTMNTLASTIQSLKKQLAEVQAKVNQAVSRQNAATDAEPAGE